MTGSIRSRAWPRKPLRCHNTQRIATGRVTVKSRSRRERIARQTETAFGKDPVDPKLDLLPVVVPERKLKTTTSLCLDFPESGNPERFGANRLEKLLGFINSRAENRLIDQNLIAGNDRRSHRRRRNRIFVAHENACAEIEQHQPEKRQYDTETALTAFAIFCLFNIIFYILASRTADRF